MIKVPLLLLCVVLLVDGRPQDRAVHIVFSEEQSNAVPAPPEPRSGVAYVYSIPVTLPPSQHSDFTNPPSTEVTPKGEAVAVNESEVVFKEVTVSKKVGFFKEEAKGTVEEAAPTDPLDPKVNES